MDERKPEGSRCHISEFERLLSSRNTSQLLSASFRPLAAENFIAVLALI